MKITMGEAECKITNKAGKDRIIKINLSSIKRYAIGPWQIEVLDGKQTYLVTVEPKGKKDE